MIVAAKTAWLVASLAAIAYAYLGCPRAMQLTLGNECFLLCAVVVAALNFPISILWWVVISALGSLVSRGVLDALMWVGFLVAGYVQWFVILPRLARRYRTAPAGPSV